MKALEKRIAEIKKEANEINRKLSSPDNLSSQEIAKLSKRQANLSELIIKIDEYEKLSKQLAENKQIINEDSGSEIGEFAKEENQEINKSLTKLTEELISEIVTADEDDNKDTILEIRAGTGGEEAELFASDLFRMYKRFSERNNFKLNIQSIKKSDLGGIKEVIIEISDRQVYKQLKYEGGVHRVQRVPETEKSGRIHTSAATVAALPIAEEEDIEIKPHELEVSTFRSSGPGGQSVNTTDSAVRITHQPTSISVSCQDEKSQLKNKEKAMKILRSRLLEEKRREEEQKKGEARRVMVGSGDRSEKIRTYNFPQNRITDHRINFTTHKLEEVLDGNLKIITNKLKEEDQKQKLAQIQ
jgi:peptide chain release factor 1